MIKRAAWLLFLLCGLPLLISCNSDEPGQDAKHSYFQLEGATMGTRYHITVLEQAGITLDRDQLQTAVDQQLQLINRQMSTYSADSELMAFNRVPVDQWVAASPNLFDVLVLSLELSWLSNGSFDNTIGPLVNLWGFGPAPANGEDNEGAGKSGQGVSSVVQTEVQTEVQAVPTSKAIARVLERVDFQALEFDLVASKIRKRRAISLDLSAIAKGYGVDKIAELLDYAGFEHYLVEIGGELRLKGHSPRGTGWQIAIERPEAGAVGQVQVKLALSDVALATSGDYRNYFEVDGQRYSHTIDPTTGYPISHNLASVTVIADSAAFADGMATAINVMGAKRGLQLAQQQDIAVYMLVKSEQGFEAIYSDAFKPYLQ